MDARQDTAGVVQAELGSDERLLWSGQPPAGLLLRPADGFMIPFSLLWGGFALYWEYAAIARGAPWFVVVWGIPLVLVGIYFVVGRFLVEARLRRRTYYAVTDQRVVIVSGLQQRCTTSLNLRTLTDLSLQERADGRGTITFRPSAPFAWWHRGLPWPGSGPLGTSFDRIPRARAVYEVIKAAQRAAS